ncbi:MAG: hypothetical protein ACPGUD_00620 [Parashewanella sp.]
MDSIEIIQNWFSEIEKPIQLQESNDINIEAQGNMTAFSFTEDIASAVNVELLHNFLNSCSILYAESNKGNSKKFYCWLDEMAGQLRMSCVSQEYLNLPFKIKLNDVSLMQLTNSLCKYDSGVYSNGALNIWVNAI